MNPYTPRKYIFRVRRQPADEPALYIFPEQPGAVS